MATADIHLVSYIYSYTCLKPGYPKTKNYKLMHKIASVKFTETNLW